MAIFGLWGLVQYTGRNNLLNLEQTFKLCPVQLLGFDTLQGARLQKGRAPLASCIDTTLQHTWMHALVGSQRR